MRRLTLLPVLVLGSLVLTMPGVATADRQWLAPVALDPDGQLLAGPAVTTRGVTLALDAGTDGPVRLEVKERGSGSFDAPIELAPQGADVGRLAVAPDGSAAAVWHGPDGVEGVIRAADGTLGPVQSLAAGDLPDLFADQDIGSIVANPSGTFGVGFVVASGGSQHSVAAVGSAPDGFAVHELGSHNKATVPALALEDDGDATAIWQQTAGAGGRWPYHAQRQVDGVWQAAQDLLSTETHPGGALLEVDPGGDAVGVLSESPQGQIHIYSSAAGATTFGDQVFSPADNHGPFFVQMDPGGHAVVAWLDEPNFEDHLIVVERPGGASPFGDLQDIALPAHPTTWETAQNRHGDIVSLIQDENDDQAMMLWRTGPASFEVRSTRNVGAGVDLLLDERGNAAGVTRYKTTGCPCFSNTAFWHAAGTAGFAHMDVEFPFVDNGSLIPGTPDPNIALHNGRMLLAGTRTGFTYAQSGTVTSGFAPPVATGASVGRVVGIAFPDASDVTILSEQPDFSSNPTGPSLWASVFGPAPPSPPSPSPTPESPGSSGAGGSTVQPGGASTSVPPAGTTITEPDAGPGPVARAARAATVTGNAVVLRLACAAGGSDCAGTATVDGTARMAAAKRRARVLARGAFSVPAGATRRVRLRLTAAGRRSLLHRRRLAARLQLRDTTGRVMRTARLVLRVR